MELPGQMTLFEVPATAMGDDRPPDVTARSGESLGDDGIELCDECGTACTSSKECAGLSGLYDEEEP